MSRNEKVTFTFETLFDDNGLVNLASGLGQLTGLTKGASTKLAGFSKSLKAMGGVATTSAVALAGVTVAIVGIVAASVKGIKAFAKFNHEMINARALTNATTKEMKIYSDEIRRMAIATTFTAGEIGAGFTQMSKMGLEYGESLSAIPSILNLALGGQEDLTTTIEIATKTMKSFNMEATDMGYITDVIALAISSSALDIQKFGNGLQYLGSTAESLGISLEDMSVHLGVLVDKNTKASRAGRLLRNIYGDLAGGSAEVNAKLKEIGSTSTTITGRINDLSEAYFVNGRGTMTLVEAQDLFGKNAAGTALKLINSKDAVEALTEKMKEYEGSTKRMADIQLTSLVNQWKLIRSYVDEIFIQIGLIVSPIAEVVTKGNEWVRSLNSAEGSVGGIYETVRVIQVTFKALSREGGILEDIIKGIAGGVQAILFVFNNTLKIVSTLAIVLDTTWRNNTLLFQLFIGVLFLGFETLVIIVKEFFEKFKNSWDALVNTVKFVFNIFGVAAEEAFNKIILGWKKVLNFLGVDNDEEVAVWEQKVTNAQNAYDQITTDYAQQLTDAQQAKDESNAIMLNSIKDFGTRSVILMEQTGKEIVANVDQAGKDTMKIWTGIPEQLEEQASSPDTRNAANTLGAAIGEGIADGIKDGMINAQNFTKDYIENLIDMFGDGNFLKRFTAEPLFGLNIPWMKLSPLEALGDSFEEHEKIFLEKLKRGKYAIDQEIQGIHDIIRGDENTKGLTGGALTEATRQIDELEAQLVPLERHLNSLLYTINGESFDYSDLTYTRDNNGNISESLRPESESSSATEEEIDNYLVMMGILDKAQDERTLREQAYYDARRGMLSDYTTEALKFIETIRMAESDFSFDIKTPSFAGAFSGDGEIATGAGAQIVMNASQDALAELSAVTSSIDSLKNTALAQLNLALEQGSINSDDYAIMVDEVISYTQGMYTEQEELQSQYIINTAKAYTEYKEAMTSAIMDSVQTINDQTFDLLNSMANAQMARDKAELDSWKNKERQKISSMVVTARRRNQLENTLADETERREKEMQARGNKLKIAEIWSSTAMGIAGAWSQAFSTTAPAFAPFVAAASTGLLLANAGVQTSAIQDGYATGGIIGASMGPDNTSINARDGEMMINADQQAMLSDFIFGGEMSNVSGGNTIHIENFSGNDEDLDRLKNMLIELKDNDQLVSLT